MLQKASSDLVISLSEDCFFAISYDIGKNVNNLFIVEVQSAIKLGHRYSSFNDLKETIIIII